MPRSWLGYCRTQRIHWSPFPLAHGAWLGYSPAWRVGWSAVPGVSKGQTELGTLRQLHGGQAGRQAGRRGKESLELGKRRGLLQGLLQG